MKKTSSIKKIFQGILSGMAVIFIPVILASVPLFFSLVFNKHLLEWELLKELFQSIVLRSTSVEVSAGILAFLIVMRAIKRNPILTINYAEHFNSLPWRPGKPLPGGAFQFSLRVWACVVTTVVFGFYWLKVPWYVFLSVAVAAQLTVVATLLFTSSRFWWLAYVIVGLGLCTVLLPNFAIMFAVAAFLLHWPMNILVHQYFADPDTGADSIRMKPPAPIPWPVSEICPVRVVKTRNRRLEWVAVYIVLTLITMIGAMGDEFSIVAVFAVISSVVLAQTARYVFTWMSPVPIVGRILRGPLIIPAYDKVFLSWLVSSAVLILGWIFNEAVPPAWFPGFAGGIVFVSLVLARLLRPELEDWKLLAPGRLPASLPWNSKQLSQI